MKWKTLVPALATVAVVVLAVTGCANSDGTQTATVAPAVASLPTGAPPSPPSGNVSDNGTRPSIDWAAAAKTLGVTEDSLQRALGTSNQTPPDMAAAARQLGVSEESLRQALGFPMGGPPSGGTLPSPPANAQ